MPNIGQHIKGVFQCHEIVVHLVEPVPIIDDLSEESWEQFTLPVKEPAPCCFANHSLPTRDYFKFPVPKVDLFHFLAGENVMTDQVEAVGDDSLAQGVVASFVTLNDGHHQLAHVVLGYASLHFVHLLHPLLDQLSNELASVSVDKDNPLVDQELFGPELNFNSLEHLHSLYDVSEHLLGNCGVIHFEE